MSTHKTANELRNALLATPLTKFGSEYLLKVKKNSDTKTGDFLINCYAPPVFEKNLLPDATLEEINTDQDIDDEEISHYHPPVFRRDDIDKMRTDAEDFETDFEALSHSVYIIEAVAGSGKTTYAKWLLNRYPESMVVKEVDFESANIKSVAFLGKSFVKHEVTPTNVFILILLRYIGYCISSPYDVINYRKYEEIKLVLKDIVDVYFQYFNRERGNEDDSEFSEFFKCLHTTYMATQTEPFSSFDPAEPIHDYLIAFLSNGIVDTQTGEKTQNTIAFLTGLLMRLFFCLSRIKGEKKKYILFVDNIEMAIVRTNTKAEDEEKIAVITDNDIGVILAGIFEATEALEMKIFNMSNGSEGDYYTSFAILLAMRDTTSEIACAKVPIFRNYHAQEKTPFIVDISKWFDFRLVFKKKVDYFVEDPNNLAIYCDAYNIMMSDTSTHSKWGLFTIVYSMYNRNFRKIFKHVTNALSYTSEKTKYFVDKWNLISQLSSEQRRTGGEFYYAHAKHLCRKLALRILLDYIQRHGIGNTGFFNSIMGDEPHKHEQNTPEQVTLLSYARRVTTFLTNYDMDHDDSYVHLASLVFAIAHKPKFCRINPLYTNVSENDLDMIAKVLDILDEGIDSRTNWTNSIFIDRITHPSLRSELGNQWERFKVFDELTMNDARVRITDAGKFFSMLLPDFEYFACRYLPKSNPIYMVTNTNELKELLNGRLVKDSKSTKNENESQVYDMDEDGTLLTGIKFRAFACVDAIIEQEMKFLSVAKKNSDEYIRPEWLYRMSSESEYIVHPIRILKSHIGYLRNYLTVVQNDDSFAKERNGLIAVTKKAINDYSEKLKTLTSEKVPAKVTSGTSQLIDFTHLLNKPNKYWYYTKISGKKV